MSTGVCEFGSICQYAHGNIELKNTGMMYMASNETNHMRQGGGQPVQVKTSRLGTGSVSTRKIVKERWFLKEELKMSEQMAQEKAENEGKISKARSKRCGMCDQCMRGDCVVCIHCKDMTKFGGSGKSKQACKERKCNSMAVKEEEDSSSETDEPVVEKLPIKTHAKHKAEGKHEDVEWKGGLSLLEEIKSDRTCIVKYCQIKTSHFMCADHMKIPIRYA